MATHIVVMGYGLLEDGKLNWRNVRRLRRAFQRVLELLAKGERIGSVILTSGSEKDDRARTMASVMEREFLGLLTREEASLIGKIELIVNRNNPSVWGTVLEMRWAYEQARTLDPNPQLEFVTNNRHGKRVMVTNKLLVKAPRCTIIPSGDTPSKLYHELLGYGKLLLYVTRTTTLIEKVENLRRKHYFGG